jgi:hypothetical protein
MIVPSLFAGWFVHTTDKEAIVIIRGNVRKFFGGGGDFAKNTDRVIFAPELP